jgi:hypothetical protein
MTQRQYRYKTGVGDDAGQPEQPTLWNVHTVPFEPTSLFIVVELHFKIRELFFDLFNHCCGARLGMRLHAEKQFALLVVAPLRGFWTASHSDHWCKSKV